MRFLLTAMSTAVAPPSLDDLLARAALVRAGRGLGAAPPAWPSDALAFASEYVSSEVSGPRGFCNWLVPGALMLGQYPGESPIHGPSAAEARAHVARCAADARVGTWVCLQTEVPAQDDKTPALAPPSPSPTPAPTPAPAPASPHVAEAPAPASLHVAEAPAPAQGIADAPAPAPAEERPRSAAAPAEARRPRPEADPEWDTLGVATKEVVPGTGLGEGALLRSVGVTGASSADAPYVDTAACIEPCVVLEVLGGVEINQRAKGLRGRLATPSSGRHVDGVSTQ